MPMELELLLQTAPWEWPKGTWEKLHGILVDHYAEGAQRLIAAELAGDLVVMNDQLADALLVIVRSADEPEELRAKAVISFGPVLEDTETGGFGDPDEVNITPATFVTIRESLHQLYLDESIPKLVRRRILEASVRAREDWHKDAIKAAYSSGDRDWVLTAVFSMRWVRGFDRQILEALKNPDRDIQREAVEAAGNFSIGAAWPHVAALVRNPRTPRPLLLAAIGAVGSIRPQEAGEILADLADSDDEEIAEAVDDALMMAEIVPDADDDEDAR